MRSKLGCIALVIVAMLLMVRAPGSEATSPMFTTTTVTCFSPIYATTPNFYYAPSSCGVNILDSNGNPAYGGGTITVSASGASGCVEEGNVVNSNSLYPNCVSQLTFAWDGSSFAFGVYSTEPGALQITVSYSGTQCSVNGCFDYAPSSGMANIQVVTIQTKTSISCVPTTITATIPFVQAVPPPNYEAACTIKTIAVNGVGQLISAGTYVGTGLTLSSSSPTGAWSANDYNWSPTITLPYSGHSLVYYADSSAQGGVVLTATAESSATLSGSEGSTTLSVDKYPTTLVLICSYDTTKGLADCNASAIGSDPSGEVSVQTSSAGAEATSCQLAPIGTNFLDEWETSCNLTITDSNAEKVTLTANYPGDANNLPSQYTSSFTFPGPTGSVSVKCDQAEISVGSSTQCTATVSGAGYNGAVKWESSPQGGQIPTSCELVASTDSSSCVVTFSSTTPGTYELTATYSGYRGQTKVNVVSSGTSMTVQCDSMVLTLGESAHCTANWVGSGLSGTISWSIVPYSATLTQTYCDQAGQSCYATLTPEDVGTYLLTASYGGDPLHQMGPVSVLITVESAATPGNGGSVIVVSPGANATTTSVGCSQTQLQPGSNTTCTSTVKGVGSVAGEVMWTATVPGTFSIDHCELAGGSCSINFTQSIAGQVTLNATYVGNTMDQRSSGVATVTLLTGGVASVDQSSTGVSVRITGASGSEVTISSARLASQPEGTGTTVLAGGSFYDVRVTGANNGTATVCVVDSSASSSTTLKYFSGGSWQTATNITSTQGQNVCGDIPVSALSGTPIVVGSTGSSSGNMVLEFLNDILVGNMKIGGITVPLLSIPIVLLVAFSAILAVRRRKRIQSRSNMALLQSRGSCPKCGFVLRSGIKFCTHCGAKVE